MMSIDTHTPPEPTRQTTSRRGRRQKPSVGTAIIARGEPMIWLTGGALAVCLLMITGLLGMVLYLGLPTFWPVALLQVELYDGQTFLGEVTDAEEFPLDAATLLGEPEAIVTAFVTDTVTDLGGADAIQQIPAELQRMQAELAARQQDVVQRIAAVEQEVERLREALSTDADSPAARAEHIREVGSIDEYEDQRNQLLMLRGEHEAAGQRRQKIAQAIEHFKEAPVDAARPAATLLEAPEDFQTLGLQALLAMKAGAEGTRTATAHRRQLRTGNYQLSGTHFTWVSDYEIKPDGETLPEWATTIERLTWGRYYGTPAAFEVHHVREPSAEETALAERVQLIEQNLSLIEEEEQAAAEEALAELQAKLKAVRQRAVAAFLEELDIPEGAERLAVTTGGERLPLAEVEERSEIESLVEIHRGAAEAFGQFNRHHPAARGRYHRRRALEKDEIGEANTLVEEARLKLREAELAHGTGGALELARRTIELTNQAAAHERELERGRELASGMPTAETTEIAERIVEKLAEEIERAVATIEAALSKVAADIAPLPAAVREAVGRYVAVSQDYQSATQAIQREIDEIAAENERLQLVMRSAQGQETTIALGEIVRAYPANRLGTGEKLGVYASRAWEFVSDEPREANSEGGVFPAIWGTVAMTLIMSIAVAPFGVLAALYLREYAKAGTVVSVIRISINNLAGVPSIVFGVFGLSFFSYRVGKWIDGGAANMDVVPMSLFPWFIGLAVVAVVSVVAFTVGLAASTGHPGTRRSFKRVLRLVSFVCWMLAVLVFVILLAKIPTVVFNGLYEANLPIPTFGTGGILWASLTLALLTLPVVIVATEEALASVPNSMREGSYGCGASKWQTIRRIVLPHALPGIMTGMILAMARGAGEVAPLMLVGAVKLAPELPLDGEFPFLHLERSFMHLGFHIFDLGFQSQNSEAAKPMVFTTTLLLIAIIAALNIAAIWLRGTLRKRFSTSQF